MARSKSKRQRPPSTQSKREDESFGAHYFCILRDDTTINLQIFFETFARNNTFYLKVAQSLHSMRTTGSINVEHRIKPLKHNIMTKKRNRLKDPKEISLLRGQEQENLKHIMRAKLNLGKKITDSL